MFRSRLACGAAALAAFALVLTACSTNATRDEGGDIVTSGAVDAFQLQAGDCLSIEAISSSSTVANVPGVPCGDPHDAEVIGSFIVTDLLNYSDEEITAQANDQCFALMDSYVGPGWIEMDSNLNVTFLSPSDSSWAEGDREVTCIAVTDDGSVSLTATVKGTL